jgi:dienelactone hydrolase
MKRAWFLLAAGCAAAGPICAQAVETPEGFLGNLTPIMESIQRDRGYALDYAHKGALPFEQWRQRGREAVERALSYAPQPVPLDLKVHRTEKRKGYELRAISFAGSAHYRIPAFLLVPESGRPPYPAVVAFHDHGAYFYFGKEKIVELDRQHASLTAYKETYYGGRSFASDLARRGFVVIVIDAFYWGERRVQYQDPPSGWRNAIAGLDPASTRYIDAVNRYLDERTADLIMQLSFNGINWIGIVNRDDRRSVDLLASLPFVDPKRIGCLGLSGGAFRSTYLAGMDSRIRAAVITGWMSTLPSTGHIPYSTHSDMYDAFGLHSVLDHPDVATLGAPECAILVQNCKRDRLFTRDGMAQAAAKIQNVCAKEGHPERFRAESYDAPHSFTVAMQEDAFAWLEKWLR